MRNEKLRSFCLIVFIVMGQSLAEVAQKEAERRRQLDRQGIEAKLIEGNGDQLSSDGNLTTFTSPGTPARKAPSDSGKNRNRVKSYRSALQKIDRRIQQDEKRLESLRKRLHSKKWELPPIGRLARSSRSSNTQAKLREQIEELQVGIRQARDERRKIYESGRKDGFLPGELEGKGIIP